VAATYDNALFQGAGLTDLPPDDKGPRFIFYATNYQTGVSFRFSRPYLADYKLGLLRNPKVPLARAVAASSAFPPVLSPLILKTDPASWEQGDSSLPHLAAMRSRIVLADGGVYDNMGLEAIWDHKEIDVVLVCDAGGPFAEEKTVWSLWPNQLGRVRTIMMEQTRALRRRMVLGELTRGERAGAFWRIKTAIQDFKLVDVLAQDTETTRSLASIRTRLNPFSDKEQSQLINWGYALTDTALRKHVDSTIGKGTWPIQEFALS
jgi:NTE family protein